MKKTKSILMKTVSFSMAGLLLLLPVSCKKEEVSQSIQTTNGRPDKVGNRTTSGEDIFRALFFLTGSFVNDIPSLANAAAQKAEGDSSYEPYQEAFADQMVDSLRNRDNDYFDNFKSALETKDYYTIHSALQTAADLMQQIMLNTPDYAPMINAANDAVLNTDQSQYDINSPSGLASYMSELQTKAKDNLETIEYGPQGIAIPVVAVWFFIWETVAVVNQIGAVTWCLYAYAQVGGPSTFTGDPLDDEVFCMEIADAMD